MCRRRPCPAFPSAEYYPQTTAVIDGMYESLSESLAVLDRRLQAQARAETTPGRVARLVLVLKVRAGRVAWFAPPAIRRRLNAEPAEPCAPWPSASARGDLSSRLPLPAATTATWRPHCSIMQQRPAQTVQQQVRNAERNHRQHRRSRRTNPEPLESHRAAGQRAAADRRDDGGSRQRRQHNAANLAVE